jgi:outer membrane protein assembly factor BamD
MRQKFFCVFLLICSFLVSCSPKNVTVDPTKQTANELFDLGQKEMTDKNYLKAREAYKAVFENFPNSDYRILAKLGYADTFYNDSSEANYVLAIQEYQDFISLFPFSPKAEYAQYQLGMSYYKMIEKPDRDQSDTHKALDEFRKVVDNYPNGDHYQDAYKMLLECYSHLSEHEYNIAYYYFRTGHYTATVERLKTLLKQYPESVYKPQYLFYLAEALNRLDQDSEACVYFDHLLQKWPTSDFHSDAKERMAAICKPAPSVPQQQ